MLRLPYRNGSSVNSSEKKQLHFRASNFPIFDVNFCSSKLATTASALKSELVRVLHCPPITWGPSASLGISTLAPLGRNWLSGAFVFASSSYLLLSIAEHIVTIRSRTDFFATFAAVLCDLGG